MKHFTLIRHAKSSWDYSTLSDHERPLSPRGIKAAPAIGEAFYHQLSNRRPMPDYFLTSTAVRAKETAKAILPYFTNAKLSETSDLYCASEDSIIETASQLDESVNHVVFFGHNPAFHTICSRIDQKFHPIKYPTCAVASFELDIEFWGEGIALAGKCVSFLKPHDL